MFPHLALAPLSHPSSHPFTGFTPSLCVLSGIQETVPRLTAMIRGIGDPLVAVYARAYLCRVRLASRTYFLSTLSHWLPSFTEILTALLASFPLYYILTQS